MNLIPVVIPGVVHPLIKEVYLKKTHWAQYEVEHTMVVMTKLDLRKNKSSDEDVFSVLEELSRLKDLARQQGKDSVKRIEIRFC